MDSYNVIANQPVVIDNVSSNFWQMKTSAVLQAVKGTHKSRPVAA